MDGHPAPVIRKKPFAVEFRASVGYCTAVVFLSVFCDLLVYSVIIPIIPFRLQQLGNDPATSSSLTGWLLVAYSLGLVLATPPIAFLAERYWSRRTPMLLSLLILIGSQVLFMEATIFWLMCAARILQGVSSATVWVVAFSLLCDTVPEKRLGQQLGIVMTGLTLGFLLGPLLSGALNETQLGYRAPFIMSISVCIFDLIGRLFVLEKHEAAPWIVGTHSPSRENSPTRAHAEADAENTGPAPAVERSKSNMSVLRVIVTLGRSKRAFTAFVNTFIYGIVFTIMEPTLPLRLQDVYGFGSLQVGIVYVATVIPSLFSTPIAGWLSDRTGMEWITFFCMVLSMPWWIVMTIRGPLALLITSLALADFFLSAVVAPLTADLAAAARELDGIGYAHVFGAFNFSYSCASAIGPLIGGQVYAHVSNGWTVLMGLSAAMMAVAAVAAFLGAGDRPLATRMVGRRRGQTSPSAPDTAQQDIVDPANQSAIPMEKVPPATEV